MENFTNINGFTLEDSNKLERVLFGDMGRAGELSGGLGLEAEPELVLANYDRLAGFITKDGVKIKTGSFWDFSRSVKAPRKVPQVVYVFNIGGDMVEVDDPANLHKAIEVVGKARAEKEEKVKKAKAKSKFKDNK